MKFKISYSISIVVFVILSGCKGETKSNSDTPIAVSVVPIKKVNRLQELDYSSTIEADNTAQVSFAVSGVVNNVAVQEGQSVNQGQLIASIDATTYSNSLRIADAGYAQALDMYNRLNELYQKGSLPARDYIEVKTKLEQAAANKRISSKQISDSRLYAPMSGIVTHRFIEKGSSAAPGIPAFTIIKTDMVYAKITVPESEVGTLKQGMPATVFIPTLNDSIKGKISIINPQADDKSRTYSVKIRLDNQAHRLLPGMLADVKINPLRNEEVIIVPVTAVVRDADDITYVFAVTNDKKAIRKRITVGNIIGTEAVIVKNGLNASDVIVTAGQSRLKDGSSVSY